ncbi:type IX secretion system motor protein PorL/GldL [Tenuifilum thalassicum]|uniref:Gliding motility protein GldL n=1 Tax=Tenuifilum thalassicum TaxID=2590900 RepID=A0A7D4AVU5_9BACT|nr:gliding motility protein GldL [Tenuifilum thalassicum]QKG78854.1 gliding motility protein GldL [Tenuifilum thalassicum]
MKINIEEIVTSKKWKNFMKYLYGWGASIVILGALFKILHLKGAGEMLFLGMGTEAIIFFFSAFEPIHEEVDWTLVYPELTGMSDEEELSGYRRSRNQGLSAEDVQQIITGVLAAMPAGGAVTSTQATSPAPKKEEHVAAPSQHIQGGSMPGALIFTEKFNKMLENAEISPALFDKVSAGLNKLGDASSKIADITNSAEVVKTFNEKLKKASESVGIFTENYSQSGQALNESINILNQNIQQTAGVMSESGKNFMDGVNNSVKNLEAELTNAGQKVSERILNSTDEVTQHIKTSADSLAGTYQQTAAQVANTFQQIAEAMSANGNVITQGSSAYKEQLERLNKNMAALNAAHELHLNETSQRLKEAEKVYKGVDGMVKNLNATIDETEKFRLSVEKLNNNVEALNSIYGNMLTAINALSNGK